jgi:hypothetical protein
MGNGNRNRNRNRKHKKLPYEDLQQARYLQRELQKNFFPVPLTRGIYLDWYNTNEYSAQPCSKADAESAVLDEAPCGASEAWIM